MAGVAFNQSVVFMRGKPFGAQSDGLIQAHPLTDDRRFADHHAGAMINEKTAADLRTGVNVNAGGRVRDLRNNPGN